MKVVAGKIEWFCAGVGRCKLRGNRPFPQGLKPSDLIGVIGTTEVVPCYRAPDDGVFPQPVKLATFLVGFDVRAEARSLHGRSAGQMDSMSHRASASC